MIKQLTKRSRIKKSWNSTCKNDVWTLQYRVKSWRGYIRKDRVSIEMYDHRFWDRKDNIKKRLSMLNLELWSKKRTYK